MSRDISKQKDRKTGKEQERYNRRPGKTKSETRKKVTELLSKQLPCYFHDACSCGPRVKEGIFLNRLAKSRKGMGIQTTGENYRREGVVKSYQENS